MTTKKKALGIMAGPRKGKSMDNIIDAVLNGTSESGAEIEKIYLYDFKIEPCLSCFECEKTHICNIDDDHQKVLDKMENADILIFGSPTFFSNVTSVTKALFDRGVRFFEMTKMGPRRFKANPSKIILITSCGAPFPISHIMGFATGCMKGMKAFFGKTSAKIYTLTATGITSFDEKKLKKVKQKAYKLGKKISK